MLARRPVLAALRQPATVYVPFRTLKKVKKVRRIPIPRPKYSPIVKEEVFPKGHPMLTTTILPHDPKEVWSFNAVTRAEKETGKYVAKAIRDKGLVPATIHTNEYSCNIRNKEKFIRCSIPLRQIQAVYKENRLFNSVFDVYVDDDPTPIQCVASTYDWHTVTNMPLSIRLLRFFEDKPIKIGLPIEYDNFYDSQTLKKGGMLRDFSLPYGWPCLWQGNRELPKSICIDLLDTRIGWNYKLLPQFLPEGLTVRRPKGHPPFVLATIQGKIRRGEDDETED